MIKCEVEVCGTITRAASIKEKSDGTQFLSFGIQVNLQGRDGSKKQMDISVSVDGDKSEKNIYAANRKIKVLGNLTIRKKGDQIYYNLRGDGGTDICSSKEEDSIAGTMQFRGKIGKKGVEEKKGKNGKTYKTFSAFSSEKDGEHVAFTWIRFLYFNPQEGEDFLRSDSYVEINGDLQVDVYKENVNLDCLVKSVSEYHFNKEQ